MIRTGVGALALCVMMANTVEARGITFSTVQIEDRPLFEMPVLKRDALEKAVELHQVMLDLGQLEGVNRQQVYAAKLKKLQQKKLADFENCALQNLMKSTSNPQEAWNKKKEAYHQGKAEDMGEYGKKEKALSGMTEFEKIGQSEANQKVSAVKGKIGEYIPLDTTTDLMQAHVRKDVQQKLQGVYDKALKEAEVELAKRAENPDERYEQDTKLLMALKSDRNGEVFFTQDNAGNFEQLKADAQMKEKMMGGIDKLDKMLDQEMKTENACGGGA